ncbi:hypothetical protein Tco_0863934 [Tanacetum coccineum]
MFKITVQRASNIYASYLKTVLEINDLKWDINWTRVAKKIGVDGKDVDWSNNISELASGFNGLSDWTREGLSLSRSNYELFLVTCTISHEIMVFGENVNKLKSSDADPGVWDSCQI